MHKRIYQITTSPVEAGEYISVSNFDSLGFLESVADYISDDIDRTYELGNLRESLEKSGAAAFDDDGSFLILPSGKEAWFRERYKEFNEVARQAVTVSLEEFVRGGHCASLIEMFKIYYCDEYGAYVSSDEFSTMPLDEFIRDCEPGERYYIGGILEYGGVLDYNH